ncbi:DUF2332 domain-containing protein [Herbidospora galbida]|uniref:DUF2332 domain-containing protein n=1 Tax=Herbidospora galbida TaxID=2575442 RepID=A0A4U3LVV4_9ACTN|nr:DUF2332 domain-containing protein [Herbidospora galbida]TKK78926.1 DUF2332 domain-containing protein [Herbidospora galbida]
MDTADVYRTFGIREARGAYRELAVAIAADPALIALIDALPQPKRQPNLVLAAVRFEGGPETEEGGFRAWAREHWPRVERTVLARRTQTNEAGRCASLLPVLAQIPGPLALIEVGASAGLCLQPDRYRYAYDARPPVGAGPVTLTCATEGDPPIPGAVPEIAWRAGVDLAPIDVTDAEERRWLECLVWPGEDARRDRLRAALALAAERPLRLVRGDAAEALPGLVEEARDHGTVVVYHSAMLPYLTPEARDRFVDLVTGLGVRWISNEGTMRLPRLVIPDGAVPEGRLTFVTALDGVPKAVTDPHGSWLRWL